jgi:hypothetical protein
MDPKKTMKQMYDFNKTVFEKTFSTVMAMQDQTERMFSHWLDRNIFFPEQGKKAIAEWVQISKNNRDEFKTKVDESYAKIDEYFSGLDK